jgi:FdhD protein
LRYIIETMTPTTDIRTAEQWRRDPARVEPISRALPEETPVGVGYDSVPYAVVMATPQDVEDLAIGFTVSERIAGYDDIEEIRVSEHEEGLVADILLKRTARRSKAWVRKRTIEGRSSCGLCGVQSLKDAVRPLPMLPDGLVVRRDALQAAVDAMDEQQPLGRETRATHAAGWADTSGRLLLVREDVGRHNALDKLIGASLKAGLDPTQAFILVTSRCSYEMVEKAAAAGVSLLAAISAPTALAVRKAEACGMTLAALARADGHAVFVRPDRVVDGATVPVQGVQA